MPAFWSIRTIGTFKKTAISELSFEFDCPKVSDLPLIQQIFYAAFKKAYRGHNAAEMVLSDEVTKETFLKNIFEAEIEAIKEGRVHCVIAKINEVCVAAATYKLNPYTGNLYLNVFGVSPNFQSKGIGKQVIALLEKQFNGLNGIELYTRKFNGSATGFYKKLHFAEKSPKLLHIDVDENKYTGFEYMFKRSRLPLQRSHSVPDLTRSLPTTMNK